MTIKRLKELIAQTHAHGVAAAKIIRELVAKLHALEALNRRRRKELKEKETTRFTMYDAVEVSLIPKNAAAVAGYVGGKFATWSSLPHLFPHAKLLSIAVNSNELARCLDVENGDATPADVPAWVLRMKSYGGVPKPCIYASLSTMPAIKAALQRAGINRANVLLWVADWTGKAHIPVGYDACQYYDKALGRNLDVSLCEGHFL